MAFDAATLIHLENALSESFNYHSALDAFILKCGVGTGELQQIRAAAEKRALGGRYERAPKRFVVQELLERASNAGERGDRIVAAMVDAILQIPIPDATDEAKAAITALREKAKSDRELLAEQREIERRSVEKQKRDAEIAVEKQRARRTAERDKLYNRFLDLNREENPQVRGYLLETFLHNLFEFEGLEPRGSFKLTGEQIDGSFAWRNKTHLLEAKWTKAAVAGAEFAAFLYKIDGKSVDTRGLFISINGYSAEAIEGMMRKGALNFVCIDGSHLMRALTGEDGLQPILERVWRYADETGNSYLPISKF